MRTECRANNNHHKYCVPRNFQKFNHHSKRILKLTRQGKPERNVKQPEVYFLPQHHSDVIDTGWEPQSLQSLQVHDKKTMEHTIH